MPQIDPLYFELGCTRPSQKSFWRRVRGKPQAIRVHLGAPPWGPLPDTQVAHSFGRARGWVVVEWKEEGLWVNGVRYARCAFRDRPNMYGWRTLHRLHEDADFAAKQLHPNVIDAAIHSGILPTEAGIGEGAVAWGLVFDRPSAETKFSASMVIPLVLDTPSMLRSWRATEERGWATGVCFLDVRTGDDGTVHAWAVEGTR